MLKLSSWKNLIFHRIKQKNTNNNTLEKKPPTMNINMIQHFFTRKNSYNQYKAINNTTINDTTINDTTINDTTINDTTINDTIVNNTYDIERLAGVHNFKYYEDADIIFSKTDETKLVHKNFEYIVDDCLTNVRPSKNKKDTIPGIKPIPDPTPIIVYNNTIFYIFVGIILFSLIFLVGDYPTLSTILIISGIIALGVIEKLRRSYDTYCTNIRIHNKKARETYENNPYRTFYTHACIPIILAKPHDKIVALLRSDAGRHAYINGNLEKLAELYNAYMATWNMIYISATAEYNTSSNINHMLDNTDFCAALSRKNPSPDLAPIRKEVQEKLRPISNHITHECQHLQKKYKEDRIARIEISTENIAMLKTPYAENQDIR